jgi:hypothetical protein
MDFVGKSLALSETGLSDAILALKTKEPEVWSVLSVETKGSGFLPNRKPKILFERHVFSRLTKKQFDASHPNISSRSAGGYGAAGSHQYDRLAKALALDEDAALKSASWGLAQIMGENYAESGFANVQDMVQAMVHSEDGQMAAFSSFLLSSKLDQAINAHAWAKFARRYNGPNYEKNQYDAKLERFYNKYSTGPLPDLNLRAAQVYLTFQGFNPRGIDGVMGQGTRNALIEFQKSAELPTTGLADSATLAKLAPS